MSYRERLDVLRSVRELAGRDAAELSALTHFTDEACARAGTLLAEEGRLCHQLVIVVEGTLAVCRQGRAVFVGRGETVGWDAMRGRGRHDATVRAVSPVHLLVMSHEQFRAVDAFRVSPQLASASCRRLQRESAAS